MWAAKGDRLVLQTNHVGDHVRAGVIVEVKGLDGAPPYLVRWADNDHESLMYPGPDAYVEHVTAGSGEA